MKGLPRHWSHTKVKYLASYLNGYPFAPTDWSDEGKPIIRIQNLTDQDAAWNRTTTEVPERYFVERGDILIAWSASLGVHVWEKEAALLNQHIFKVTPIDTVNRQFYLWAAKWFIEELQSQAHGSTMQHLTKDVFGGFAVPLPPPNEQERIANFLDEQTARIDGLIAAKKLLVEKLRAFQYSRSSHLMTRGLIDGAPLTESSFPEVGAVPSHWTVKPLKFLGDVRSGVAKGKDLGDKDTVSLPYLRVANVQDGYVDLNEVSEIEIAASDATRYLLRKGDVLMNEGGDNDKLGRGAVWQGQIEPCIHQNHVFAVRLQNPADADWVSRFTSTDAARTYFFLRSKQSTNLASINQSNVRELPVPMPPDDERAQILAEVVRMTKATSALVEHAIAHVARLQEYRSSLISAAVTGQLDINSYKEAA